MNDLAVRPRAKTADRLANAALTARHARLFEMLRQRELASRALRRLHHGKDRRDDLPLPSAAALAATLQAHCDVRLS
ncbi:MAG: hypothetical protein ACNA7Q_13575 [Rhodobacterales bacterium]